MAGGIKRWFLERYFNHLERQANRRREKIRQLQTQSGMRRERVVRYEISEADVQVRGMAKHTFTAVVGAEGEFRRVADVPFPDIVVRTDFPTIWAIAKPPHRYVQALRAGGKKVHENFTVFDAVRIGKIEWEGTSSALQELMLLDRRIIPEFIEAMRLPGDDPVSAPLTQVP